MEEFIKDYTRWKVRKGRIEKLTIVGMSLITFSAGITATKYAQRIAILPSVDVNLYTNSVQICIRWLVFSLFYVEEKVE